MKQLINILIIFGTIFVTVFGFTVAIGGGWKLAQYLLNL